MRMLLTMAILLGLAAPATAQTVFQHPIGTPPQCKGRRWNCTQNRWCEGVPIGADRDPTPGRFPWQYQSLRANFGGVPVERRSTFSRLPRNIGRAAVSILIGKARASEHLHSNSSPIPSGSFTTGTGPQAIVGPPSSDPIDGGRHAGE